MKILLTTGNVISVDADSYALDDNQNLYLYDELSNELAMICEGMWVMVADDSFMFDGGQELH